jgi:pimeloyl-ACP methyl ester carboxylesterase
VGWIHSRSIHSCTFNPCSSEGNWRYTLVPPLLANGYKPCYVDIPQRLFGDAQISAEYVAHAINQIADEHHGKPIVVVGWSQGCVQHRILIMKYVFMKLFRALITQWVLAFYPQTRKRVEQFVAIAGSLRGSLVMAILLPMRHYTPSIIQQIPWSRFLQALRRVDGGTALIPTTCIGSATDPIVQPGVGGPFNLWRPAWSLDGALATNIDVSTACRTFIFHDALLWHPVTHVLIFAALSNSDSSLNGTMGEDALSALIASQCTEARAPHLLPEWDSYNARIMPELSEYAQKQDASGWPEVPLMKYAEWGT